jgi:PAS domain S-box-containing protein
MRGLQLDLAWRVALFYAFLGGLWILFSDRLLLTLVADPRHLTELQSYKGWGFVAASTVLIYLLLRHELEQRLQAEQALRESERRFREIIQNAQAGYFFVDDAGNYRDVNQTWLTMHGYDSAEEVIGQSFAITQVEAEVEQARQLGEQVLQGKPILSGEFSRRCKDGSIKFHTFSSRPVRKNERVIGLEGFMIDITERKQAEEQLRNLTRYLQTAREEERAHIAREIHDEFGQALTALKIDLSWLTRHLPSEQPVLLEKIQTMASLLNHTMQTVRRVATELRPGLLDDLGLLAAIEWQAQEFTARTGIACDLRLDEHPPPFERDLNTTIFRIFQESLTNVARHAKATRIQVEVDERPDRWMLTIADNGQGITTAQIASPQSLGLMGIRERARAWGGKVSFAGKPGQGTTVTVVIPQTRI